jgi:16S rRNA (adenine1518-N6/adenine1519-N6)-dimethyltransferase
MKHIARKRFGQHFLSDAGIIDAIVTAIAPQPGEPMVEIGPGLAALTQPLVERVGRLTVIELDRDLAVRLRAHGQLDVIESDVLKVDFTALAQRMCTPTSQTDIAAGPPQGGTSPLGGLRPAQRRSVGVCVLLGGLQHGLGNTAQDVDFLFGRVRAVEQRVQA